MEVDKQNKRKAEKEEADVPEELWKWQANNNGKHAATVLLYESHD